MNRRKEIWILFVGTFAFLLLVGLFFTLIYFRNWVYVSIVIIAYYLFSIVLAFYLFNSSKRIINVKLCWILVIFCIPIMGLFIFLIFGINPLLRIKRKKYIKNQEKWIKYESFDFSKSFLSESNSEYNQFFNYAFTLQNRPIYSGNEFELINSNNLYKKSIELIRSAKKFIHLQYYIVADGVWFRTIANELIKQAKKGIKIRFIYDWVGSYFRGYSKIIKKMREAGILIGVFNPKTFTKYTSKTNFRCHRKCLIVDNEKVLYGGSNLGDEYICYSSNLVNWYDNNLLISGLVVNTFNLIFCLDWRTNTSISKKQKNLDDLNTNKSFYLNVQSKELLNNISKDNIAQVFETSPSYNDFSLSTLLTNAISNAKKRIWITTPYFIPNTDITNALKFAATIGIDVRLVLPGFPDDKKYILTINRSHYDQLISSGVKIYEYNGFIHSKIILIDDLTIFGTSNLDFRSLFINYESEAIIYNIDLSKKYENELQSLFKISKEIFDDSFSFNEKNLIKVKMWFLNIYHPLL
ncbi:cardiolipin synthase [Mycoplasmoides pirum]|uniref:cardiolipin synthase n=1 Tax=Mycoplasmoides pirum TaxID=2122 RepID=UPI0004895FC4|nr:cardiolipin synthase [Mycoplasmoides pirum]